MSQEKYLSPEEHQMNAASSASKQSAPSRARLMAIVGVAIVLCGLSFFAGTRYQQHHGSSSNTAASGSQAGFRGRGGFGQRGGGLGQVTTISANSITIRNQRTGSSQTYSITSTTTITDNGQTVTTADIKTGDNVIVVPTSSGGTTASRILANPGFGGGGGNPDQASGSTPQSD